MWLAPNILRTVSPAPFLMWALSHWHLLFTSLLSQGHLPLCDIQPRHFKSLFSHFLVPFVNKIWVDPTWLVGGNFQHDLAPYTSATPQAGGSLPFCFPAAFLGGQAAIDQGSCLTGRTSHQKCQTWHRQEATTCSVSSKPKLDHHCHMLIFFGTMCLFM